MLRIDGAWRIVHKTWHVHPAGHLRRHSAGSSSPKDGSLPDGQIFHAAGPSTGGWTIMAVHDSRESWERFRDDILMPRTS